MTNWLTIVLIATNWLGQPIPSVWVSYRTPGGPCALMVSRDLLTSQIVVYTTNDSPPHHGTAILPMLEPLSFFYITTNVFIGFIPIAPVVL